MTIFAAILLAVISFGVVVYPLLKPRPQTAPATDDPLDELFNQKDAAYSAIKELEFDYALGNLTKTDHSEIEEKYKDKAVNLLKEIDAQQRRHVPDDILEREISRRRRQKSAAPPDDDVEREIMQRRRPGKSTPAVAGPAVACPNCGNRVQGAARFCSRCGHSLATNCPGCGAEYHSGDTFCAHCGTNLKKGTA